MAADLEALPPTVLGARLRRARLRQGLSIRELAAAAEVNKNSIVRLEKGLRPLPQTVLKVCEALKLHVAAVVQSASIAEDVAVHKRADDRWYDIADLGAGPAADRPLSREERAKLAEGGLTAPMLLLTNRLEQGHILANVVELYGPSPKRSHPGEEMVYVLEGQVRITVGSRVVELEEGECATFHSAEVHEYAPAGTRVPVSILSITVPDKP
jgi:transcriptional regulator with XRE-family HTH domain